MLTKEIVMGLKRGTKLYHNVIEFTREDGTKYPAVAVVRGRARSHETESFSLPITRKYGGEGEGTITVFAADQWRLTEEKSAEDGEVLERINKEYNKPQRIVITRDTARVAKEPARVVRTSRIRAKGPKSRENENAAQYEEQECEVFRI